MINMWRREMRKWNGLRIFSASIPTLLFKSAIIELTQKNKVFIIEVDRA